MKQKPLKNVAYEFIKERIINCTYAPDTVINEEMILQELNASRTPVRDALSRLEQEGLITIIPKKGIRIRDITLQELNMLYETRFLLEPYALKNYGNRIPEAVYAEYYRLYKGFSKEEDSKAYSFEEMDAKFHRMLIEATQNTYFISMYSTIESQIARTRYLTGNTSEGRIHETMQEHMKIVEEALKADWTAAADAMYEHLKHSKDSYFDYLLSMKA